MEDFAHGELSFVHCHLVLCTLSFVTLSLVRKNIKNQNSRSEYETWLRHYETRAELATKTMVKGCSRSCAP